MHYPWWYVPLLTSPMLIAAIAVLHVLVAHYAVGGGLFLAVEVRHAYRTHNRPYLAYLKQHAWFFILLTVVYGAITGVGIWWTIGLASPLATRTLIHIFVFGWAMEYVTFIVEIVAAFIFYYYWGRPDPKTHQTMGWIYAGAAWLSLVLITGITGFMLNPGVWLQHQNFWLGMLNPQFVPQVLVRTGGALLLASLYVYLHAAFKLKDPALRDLIAKRSSRPALLGSIMILIGALGWFAFLPESARAALTTSAVLTVFTTLIFAITAIVFVMLYLGPYRNPGWVSPGFAILLFILGVSGFSTGEFLREAVRKPYIVYNVVMGNQLLTEQIPQVRKNGYLESGTWTKAFVASQYPQVMDGTRIVQEKLRALPAPDQVRVGQLIFQYHCNNCHSAKAGYSAVAHLMRGWTPEIIRGTVPHLGEVNIFMPQWLGTPEEAEMLAKYLASIALPRPGGMR